MGSSFKMKTWKTGEITKPTEGGGDLKKMSLI